MTLIHKHSKICRRPLALFTALTTVFFFLYLTRSLPVYYSQSKSSLHNLDLTQDIVYLQNVQTDESEFSSGKNIFFVVSTLSQNGEIKLTARQACAIESAARANTDWKVFPLFVETTWYNSSHNEFISPLLRYCNVHMRYIDLETIARGTPVENLFTKRALENSSYIVEHTSDVLRLLMLFKFGGTYLDTDVIVRRSLNLLLPNYLGAECRGSVANRIINLEASGFGHRFAEACLNDLSVNFNGKEWIANGPKLVTRNLIKMCNVSDATEAVTEISREQCGGQISVHPPDMFYRIRSWQHEWFFYPTHTRWVLYKIKNDIIVHVWNSLTRKIQQKVNSATAYVTLAHEFCPNVMKTCVEFF